MIYTHKTFDTVGLKLASGKSILIGKAIIDKAYLIKIGGKLGGLLGSCYANDNELIALADWIKENVRVF